MVFPYLKKMYLFLCHQRVSSCVCVCQIDDRCNGMETPLLQPSVQLDGVTHGNGAMMTAKKANKLVAH